MEQRSEEEIMARLLELENDGQAERRAELTDERFLSLLHDPDTGRSYILRHGADETEGAEIPSGTEFYEYPTADEAQRAYDQLLDESRRAGELVDEDSSEDIGDFESSGAEIRDMYADLDEDELTQDRVLSEEDEDVDGDDLEEEKQL
jgi:hypothetical protein